MKIALISYHKNIDLIYPEAWIKRHRDSILKQTFKKFDIWELNYGGGEERIFSNSKYISKEFPSFVHAMNYLLKKLYKLGYDAVANLNCDDWYAPDRLKIQLPYLKKYDLISSNFALIRNNKEVLRHAFHELDIYEQLSKGHNIIAHPAAIYSRKFIEQMEYDPAEVPKEDLMLWLRALNCGLAFKIVPECLLFHQLHQNSVCNSNNR